jgi:putative transcriptional regulator
VKKALFAELVESLTQAGEISRGEREPSRVFNVDAQMVKKLRSASGLSQKQFASLVCVDVGTLRNWEQGIRTPSGPAKALLVAIKNDPKNVLKALRAS